MMDEVFYDTIFNEKKERIRFFDVNSTIKNTVNGIFNVKIIFGEW